MGAVAAMIVGAAATTAIAWWWSINMRHREVSAVRSMNHPQYERYRQLANSASAANRLDDVFWAWTLMPHLADGEQLVGRVGPWQWDGGSIWLTDRQVIYARPGGVRASKIRVEVFSRSDIVRADASGFQLRLLCRDRGSLPLFLKGAESTGNWDAQRATYSTIVDRSAQPELDRLVALINGAQQSSLAKPGQGRSISLPKRTTARRQDRR